MKIRLDRKYSFPLLAALFSLFVFTAAAQAHSQALITRPIDATQRKVLGNSVHPLANSANDRGHAEASLPMKDMLLLLQPAQAQATALKQTIDDLHNPKSASFHQWLTPEQFATQFGASDADLKTISDWLSNNGFSIEQVARGKNWIRFSGTSSQVESAFQTSIHQFSVNGAVKYSNASPLSIPAALAPAVAGVVSTNNFESHAQHIAPAMVARNKSGKLARVANSGAATAAQTSSPAFTSAGSQEENYLLPGDFSTIYNTQPLVASGTNGSGVSIAIVGRSDIDLSDVEAFRTISGLPFNDPRVIYATTDPGDVPGDDVEASLDVEWSGAIAPQATINYVVGATTSTTDGVDISAAYSVDNVVAPILSVSFGLCEADVSDTEIAFYQLLWQQAAAEGITVFIAAGDSGASGCNSPDNQYTVDGFGVNGLASSAYDVAVGGTEFNESDPNTYWNVANGPGGESAKGYIPEAVWNESCTGALTPTFTNCYFAPYDLDSFAGGGGASSCAYRTTDSSGNLTCTAGYAKPSWQTAPGVPADGVRDLPDVALAAAAEHDGYILCQAGSCQWTTNSDGSISLQQAAIVGGTSAATPSMAGIMALVEQKHGLFQGVANYQLYKLAAAQDATACNSSTETNPATASACVFNDITTGSNAVACYRGSPNCGATPTVSTQSAHSDIVRPPNFLELNGYSAAAGYDLASGLGSVNAANLVNAWGVNNTLASTTKFAITKTTFQHGTPVTWAVQVSPAAGSGTPSGNIWLKSSTTGPLQSEALSSGYVSDRTINLPGGTYTLTADYSGDATYAASASKPVSVTVTPESSTATATTYAYSVFFVLGQQPLLPLTATALGKPFFIQVQIQGASGSTGATGTVQLLNGSNLIGTFPLDKTGSIYVQCGPGTPCDLGVGSYNFTAKYSGDASFSPTTTTIPFTVNQGLLYWNVFANTQTPPVGGRVLVTVLFNNDPLVVPTGTVRLTRSDTGAYLGAALISSNGIASIAFNAPAGSYFLNVSYPGDSNYIPIGQRITQQIVTTSPGTVATELTLTTGYNVATLGQRTPFSVAVTPTKSSARPPLGTVTLYSTTGQISSPVELTGGKASGFVEWDQVGPQHFYALYSGDSYYAGSSSQGAALNVAKAVPTVVVQPQSSTVAAGVETSITAQITSPLSSTNAPAPTGTIQFFDAVNGAAPQALGTPQTLTNGNGGSLLATIAPSLAAGSHEITAVYSGDTNWKTAVSKAIAPIVVTTPSFTITATPNPLALVAGQTAAITVSTQSVLGYNTQIALTCGGSLPVGVTCGSATVAPGASASLSLVTTAPGESEQPAASVEPHKGSDTAPGATSLILSSSGTKAALGSNVTLFAILESSRPLTGTVTFYDGANAIGSPVVPINGAASLTTSKLTVGTHAITAKYSGDSQNAASTSTDVVEQLITGRFSVTVNAISGTITHTITIPATLN